MTLRGRLANAYQKLHDWVASVADFDQVLRSQVTVRTRAELERMVILCIALEMAGVSIAPPRLVAGLMPHFVPLIYQWRRAVSPLSDPSDNIRMGC